MVAGVSESGNLRKRHHTMRYEHTFQSHNGVLRSHASYFPRSATDRVKSLFRVAVISDEITQDFDHACYIVAREFGMEWIELRSMWNKNMVNFGLES